MAVMDELRQGIEHPDAARLSRLYADDAVIRIIDRTTPPSRPRELRGRSEIEAFYRDVCGRDMIHRIEQALVDDGRIAFIEACEYRDGMQVFCAAFAELKDGKIARQTNLQAWDEAPAWDSA